MNLITRLLLGKEQSMRPTPSQPFHKDLNPDLGQFVDDFLAEIDRLLHHVDRKTSTDTKEQPCCPSSSSS